VTDGTITVPADRADETTQALSQAGVTLETKTSPSIHGGFVVSTPRADYDYSFKGLVTQVRQHTELDIANTLFGSSS